MLIPQDVHDLLTAIEAAIGQLIALAARGQPVAPEEARQVAIVLTSASAAARLARDAPAIARARTLWLEGRRLEGFRVFRAA